MEKITGIGRKINRMVIFGGDIAAALLTIGVIVLDWRGYIDQIAPFLAPPIGSYIAFGLFIISHFYQRWHFQAQRPCLQTVDSGWQAVNNGERLYIEILNLPTVLTQNGNSISTGASVTLYNKKTKEKLSEFENVRWQGTGPPVPDRDYQPYNNWCVDIDSGRTRLLYIGARMSADDPAYTVSDDNYNRDGTFNIGGVPIPPKAYFRIVLWASNYDHKEFWFKYKKGDLFKLDKKPKK